MHSKFQNQTHVCGQLSVLATLLVVKALFPMNEKMRRANSQSGLFRDKKIT